MPGTFHTRTASTLLRTTKPSSFSVASHIRPGLSPAHSSTPTCVTAAFASPRLSAANTLSPSSQPPSHQRQHRRNYYSSNTRVPPTPHVHSLPSLQQQTQTNPSDSRLPDSAWSTSPLNPGNPFIEDPTLPIPYSPRDPLATTPSATQPAYDALALAVAASWTFSPVNTGNPIFHLHSSSATMASDEDYAAFLDKASAGANAPSAQTTASNKPQSMRKTVTTASVPAPLQRVNATYTSDADEPFEPVALSHAAGKLDKASFAKLVDAPSSDVTEMTTKDFDPRGEYGQVIQAVEEAAAKDVRVFRVEGHGARVEYWVVGLKGKDEVVGMRAVAVES